MKIFIVALMFIVGFGGVAEAEDTVVTVTMPDAQKQTMQAVIDSQAAYKDCANALKCSSAKKVRDKAISAATNRGKIVGWYGQIATLDTTHEGDAILTLSGPSESISFSTWNNAFSDMSDKTLIKSGSPLYETLAEMKVGQWVIFSGQIKGEQSLTEAGGMAEPVFTVRFSDVRAVGLADGETN